MQTLTQEQDDHLYTQTVETIHFEAIIAGIIPSDPDHPDNKDLEHEILEGISNLSYAEQALTLYATRFVFAHPPLTAKLTGNPIFASDTTTLHGLKFSTIQLENYLPYGGLLQNRPAYTKHEIVMLMACLIQEIDPTHPVPPVPPATSGDARLDQAALELYLNLETIANSKALPSAIPPVPPIPIRFPVTVPGWHVPEIRDTK
jgi:hypothetical protein